MNSESASQPQATPTVQPPVVKPPPIIIVIDDESDNDMVAEQPLMQPGLKDLSIEQITILNEQPRPPLIRPVEQGATKLEPPQKQPTQLVRTPSIKPYSKEPCTREIKALNQQLVVSKELKRRECNVQQQRPDTITMIEEYIPDQLVVLDHVKIRDSVPVGERYQAEIKPPKAMKYNIPNPTNQLIWRSSSGFNQQVFEQFQQMFGERRTTEELCHLLTKTGGNWAMLPQIIQHYRRDLKKMYSDTDSRL